MSEQIEGLAPWLKIKRIGFVRTGEHFLDKNPGVDAKVRTSSGYYDSQLYIVVEPNNIYNGLYLDNFPIPVNFKRVEKDWFRAPQYNEFFITANSTVVQMLNPKGLNQGNNNRIIVEPRKQRYLVVKFPMRFDKQLGPFDVDKVGFFAGHAPVSAEVIEE